MERNGTRDATPRPLWLTATLAALGIVGGPLLLLAFAVIAEGIGLEDAGAVGTGFAVYVTVGVVLAWVHATRPLGLGMLVGSLAVVLMFVLTGGTN